MIHNVANVTANSQTMRCAKCPTGTVVKGAFLWDSSGEIIGRRFHCTTCGHTEDYA